MEYVIVSSSGTKRYLTKDNVSNRYVAATNVSRAIKFDSQFKAKNVIENSLTNKEKDKWKVIELESVKDIKIVKAINNIKTEEINWMSKISELSDFKNNLTKSKTDLYDKLSYTDREISDVYHFIGNHYPPAHIRTKIYGIEQELVQRRAKIKEQIRYIDVIINIFNSSFNKEEIEKQLQQVQDADYKNRTDTYYKLENLINEKKSNLKMII